MNGPAVRVLSPPELRRFRARHKLSQQELGQLLGLTRNTVARWEAGIRPIPQHMNLILEGLALHLPHRRRGATVLEPRATALTQVSAPHEHSSDQGQERECDHEPPANDGEG